MTRLTDDWVMAIGATIEDYDRDLTEKVGKNLRDLAFSSIDRIGTDANANLETLLKNNKAAVIRINTGEGVIPGFDYAVASILRHLGIETIMCECGDIKGVNEAINTGANILFMADDYKYIAINIKNNKKSDNDYATALGYVSALEIMADGLDGKRVALLGYGRVGHIAADFLAERGAQVHIYDKRKIQKDDNDRIAGIIDSVEDIANYKLIFDSTSEGSWLGNEIYLKDTLIVSPGIPLSFDLNQFQKNNLIVADILQIGTAVMLAEVI